MNTHFSIADPNVLLGRTTLALFIRVDEVLSNRSTFDNCLSHQLMFMPHVGCSIHVQDGMTYTVCIASNSGAKAVYWKYLSAFITYIAPLLWSSKNLGLFTVDAHAFL